MMDLEFEEMIQDYLLDFNDGHLSFYAKNTQIPYLGFSIRRFEDALYVTKAREEKRLSIGDKITLIDGKSIPELAETHRKRLEDDIPERQNWFAVLSKATTILVERDTASVEITLTSYDKSPIPPEYSFKQMEPDTAYIKLTDFAQEAPIKKILEENKDTLENSENLIVDVRVNHGGNDSFYFALLDYLFDQKIAMNALFAEDETMQTNHTERNYQLWIPELKEYLTQDLDESTRKLLTKEIKKFEQHRGEGLVEEMIEGGETPKQVYVLSDYYCGSSGDTFVANAKKSPKVTVVGRPTMGIIDYFNVVTVDYGKYEFIYSIAKINQKYATNGKGIAPDIYIPWTPEHLERDMDLEYVIQSIKNSLVGVDD